MIASALPSLLSSVALPLLMSNSTHTKGKLYHIDMFEDFAWDMSLLFNNLCLCDSDKEC